MSYKKRLFINNNMLLFFKYKYIKVFIYYFYPAPPLAGAGGAAPLLLNSQPLGGREG